MKPSTETTTSITDLDEWFKNASDIVRTSYKGTNSTLVLELVYCPNLVDMNFMNDTILPRISIAINTANGDVPLDQINTLLGVSSIKDDRNVKNEIEQKLFSGELVIFNVQSNGIFSIPISNAPKRTPEESNSESSVRGPRDGFVENIADNMALIRQRLKTTSLKSIEYTIGQRSKTKVLLLYIEDILNPSILTEVQKRLTSIHIDILGGSNQLEEMLYDTPFSIFPLMDYVGRPDFVVESLNQGRFAIIVDGNPTCLIGPTSLTQLSLTPEDMNSGLYYVSFVRMMRLTSLFITIFLPGFFTALTTFHHEQIPFSLLATIGTSRVGVPFSPSMEVFIMISLFELFKEAARRLPKAIGQTVSVLGALIIGDAAIRAGLTSPTMLVVISISTISSYTLINQNLAGNIVLLRYFVLIMSFALGLYGLMVSFFFIITIVFSLESFGQSYAVSFTSPNWSNTLKGIVKLPTKLLKKRNIEFEPTDTTRQKE